MSWRKEHRWWGLYLLVPLSAGMLYVDSRIHTSLEAHEVLTVVIVILVAVLAVAWTERHAELMESEGVDAQVSELRWQATGFLFTGASDPLIPMSRLHPALPSLTDAQAMELHDGDTATAV